MAMKSPLHFDFPGAYFMSNLDPELTCIMQWLFTSHDLQWNRLDNPNTHAGERK